MSYDPQAIYEGLVKIGDEWAERLEAADLLESAIKPVLAQLTLKFLETGEAKNKTNAELLAIASDDYREHITAAVGARKMANKARVRYDAARAKASGLQTLEANARERIKRTGMD